MQPIFYVYTLAYPDGTPFYVGKGKGTRIKDHGTTRGRLRRVNEVLASLAASGQQCLRSIVKDGLTEVEAFDLERSTILSIGREPSGPLVNLNDGGWGGRNMHPSTLEKLRLARLSQPKPERSHMVAMNRKRGPWTDEQKAKVSAALKGRVRSEEHKRRISEAKLANPYRPGVDRMRELNAISQRRWNKD